MGDHTATLDFDDRVAVIVGAGPGLGATLARRFAACGARPVVVARSEGSLDAAGAAARTAGVEPLAIRADITIPADAARMADTVLHEHGRVDVLVNLAFGGLPRRDVLDLDEAGLEQWRKVVEVGGFGAMVACRYLAPAMVAQGSGSIVMLTSMSSRIGFGGRSEYAAGKAQAHKLAHSLADELGPHGVRVNCVAPGHIWSEQLARFYESRAQARGITYDEVVAEITAEMALRRIVTEDEVANAVLFLASDLASGITGAVLDVNAGHLFAP